MNANRKRITELLKNTPRGFAIVTDTGDHRILEDRKPDNGLFETVGSDLASQIVVRFES